MRKLTKYINGEIQLSWLKDKRHTTKPYTKQGWYNYEHHKSRLNTNELARKYGVSKRTIYKWNQDLKEFNEKWDKTH